MTQRVNDFDLFVRQQQAKWKLLVGIPYLKAYDTAYKKFGETMQQQKDVEKDRADLLVTAASVVSGSLLMATIGKVAAGKLITRSLYRLAIKNLGATFGRIVHTGRHNEAFAFALGKFLDEVKTDVAKRVKDGAAKYMHVDAAESVTPMAQTLDMDAFLTSTWLVAVKAAQTVEAHSGLSEVAKTAAFGSLRAAPMMQEPVVRRSSLPGTLAEKIELSFYLGAVLDSDTLVDWPAYFPTGAAGMSGPMPHSDGSRPIAQLPSDPSYPRPRYPEMKFGGVTPRHQSIAIDRSGSEVQSRTDELCRLVFRRQLYGGWHNRFGLFGPADTKKPAELLAAERMLDDLSNATRPMSAVDARN